MKKMTIVFEENGMMHLARKICTVYEIEEEFSYRSIYKTIHLFNLCYVKATDEFALNKAIQLPRRLINRYDGATDGIDSKIKEMEAIGILDIELLRKKFDLFKECKDFIIYSEYRNKLLNESKESLRSIEVIDTLAQLRQELIMTATKNDSIFKIESEDV